MFQKILSGISGGLKIYQLEKLFKPNELTKAVKYRRKWYEKMRSVNFFELPYNDQYGSKLYPRVYNKNCENVVGYVPIPVGLVGPLKFTFGSHYVPLATTEGALVASINRGSRLIENASDSGIDTYVYDHGISRAPIIELPDLKYMSMVKEWINQNMDDLSDVFSQTTNYGKLKDISFHLPLEVNKSTTVVM